MKNIIMIIVVSCVGVFCSCDETEETNLFPPINEETVNYIFDSNVGGYKCYRIPEIEQAPNGDLLAFVEARKFDCDDFGYVDIVMKRSTDQGMTWSTGSIVANNGENKCGDIAVIVDKMDVRYPSGRIFMLYNTATEYMSKEGVTKRVREAWYKTSTDNGNTWSEAVNITTSVHKPYAPEYNPAYNFPENWQSMVNGPASGLQVKNGSKKGRLYVSSNHSIGTAATPFGNYFSNGYYSDDHGETWNLSPDIAMPCGNEGTAAELKDGTIVQNFRYQYLKDPTGQTLDTKYRVLCSSSDSGDTWGKAEFNTDLPTPVCQGCMIDVVYKDKHYLLFSHPDNNSHRVGMTIFVSGDEGKTWTQKYLVDKGPGAYSALVCLDNDCVGIAYELGNTGGIAFKKIKLEDVIK